MAGHSEPWRLSVQFRGCVCHGFCHPCAFLQCLTFQTTIIIDRTDKETKKKQREREALELKSAVKVEGSKAEAVLLQQQLGTNNLCHRLSPARKEPKKDGWCVWWHKQRTKPVPFAEAHSEPAAGCRFEMGNEREQPFSCKYHCPGDTGRVTGWCPCFSLATSNRCPQPSYGCLWHNQHRPKGCCMGCGFPSVAGEHREDSPGIELYQVPQQVVFPQASLSLTSRCRPGGKVQWSADSSAPTRSLRSIWREKERRKQARKNREQRRKELSKERGHRCAPGLLLGRALWYVWQDKINHVTELGQFWRTQFLQTQLWWSCTKDLKTALVQPFFPAEKGICIKAVRSTISPAKSFMETRQWEVICYQPSNSAAWDALHPEPALPPKHWLWLWVRQGGWGSPSWAPSVLSMPPALASGQQGEHGQVCSVNTRAVKACRFPFPQSCTVSVHRQNSSIYLLTKEKTRSCGHRSKGFCTKSVSGKAKNT